MALPLDLFNASAQDFLDGRVRQGFFERNTFLSLLSGRNMASKARGKPGLRDLLGSMRPKTAAEKQSLRGSTFYEPVIMTAKFGGGGGVGYRDTAPQVTTLDTHGAIKVPWTLFMQQVKVSKDDLQAASGQFEVVRLLRNAMDIGVQELEENVSTSVWAGNPASQTAKQLAAFVGIVPTLDPETQDAYFGSAGRKATDTFLLPAYYSVAAAHNFDWSLISNVNKGGGDVPNPNGGAATLGNGVDLVLCNETLFYDTIEPKARADGHQIITSGGMQEIGLVGFERPVVKYMNTLITFDPSCPAGQTGKSAMACLTLGSWTFQVHPDSDFKIGPWVDLQNVGTRERALAADIELKGRLVCERPWLNGFYDDVN